ncbi:MAG TPA: DinB family protein [Acidimicrobiales bacterium]|nr:DinB family protein [Acidimicrobiales bacterium]
MRAPDPAAALARLKGTVRELVSLLATAKPDLLSHRPGPDEWSPATVVAHLADAELVYSVRLRMVVTGDRPYLSAYDEDAWVRRFAELEPDAKESLARFRTLREANVRLLESLDETEWKLSGLHAERGEQSIAQIAQVMADHDRDHINQIRAGLAED